MIRIRLIGTLAVASATLFVVACGSADDTIPPDTASALTTNLKTLKDQVAAQDCTSADETLNAINDDANKLSGDVESGMRELLSDLENLFAEQCVDVVEPPPSSTTSSSSSSSTTSDSTDTSTSTSTETTTSTDSTSTPTTDSTSTTDSTTPGGGGGSGSGGTAPRDNKQGGR